MIKQIIASLNQLEVKGKENLDILLGCILALEEYEKQISTNQNVSESKTEGIDNA